MIIYQPGFRDNCEIPVINCILEWHRPDITMNWHDVEEDYYYYDNYHYCDDDAC